jgi:phage terminase small subunit
VPKSRLRSRGGLLPREAAFVRELPKDFNLTKAAVRAGYSARTAHVQGSQVLGRVRVRAALEARLAKQADRADVSAERVLRELAAVALSDARDFASWTRRAVRLTPSAALPDGAAACVQEVSAGRGGVRVRLHDKVAALEKLARHLGLFPTSRAAVVAHGGAAAVAIGGGGRRRHLPAGQRPRPRARRASRARERERHVRGSRDERPARRYRRRLPPPVTVPRSGRGSHPVRWQKECREEHFSRAEWAPRCIRSASGSGTARAGHNACPPRRRRRKRAQLAAGVRRLQFRREGDPARAPARVPALRS